MKIFRYILVAIALTITSVTAQEMDNKVDKISRATLVVHDMDRAVHLFQDILGLRVSDVMTISGDEISRQMGYDENITMSFAGVDGGDDSINVALMSIDSVDMDPPERPARLEAGSVVLVMSAQDIYQIYEDVTAEGYAIISEPGIPFPRDGIKEQGVNMLFVGPGGAIIELSKPSVR